ncbi:MAG: hypothetical protein HYT49_02795, partial [Candidatus Wildermuthbacteria bacterium]|nr:hypothetical protein [Candidatus Wildermuthbacteria bacterium]
MPNTFSSTGGTAHTTTVSGLSDGSTFSYFVRCRDSVGNVNTTDALIEFSVEETPDTTPPVRSNGQPTSTLPTGTSQTAISLATDENATCKYATISGVTFASMANTFSTTGGTSHSAQVSGLSNGNTFSYFVRCRDGSSNANTNDFLIQFSVDSPLPPPDTTPPSRSSGQPVGPLSSGTTATSISLATDESATCKYATSVGVSYDSMANTFSSTGGISHSASVAGLSDGSAFSYYVRCKDSLNNKNTDDFLIEFSVAQAADTTPPSRSAGFPTGTLPAGTTSTTVSLATDENAT